GSQANTSSTNVDATLLVQIDGVNTPGTNVDGLRVLGNDVLIRGLMVTRFSGSGIHVIAATNVVVTENFLGTDNAGMTAQSTTAKKRAFIAGANPERLGNGIGLRVDGGHNFSTVPLLAEIYGNLLVGNSMQGAFFDHSAATLFVWNYLNANGGLD